MGRPWSPVALSGGTNLTLDVIVEHAVLVPVFVEQAEGIGIGKIFKLDEAIYSKPVVREREELMIASLWPVPGRSQPALGSRGHRTGGTGGGTAHALGLLPLGWLLDSWALLTPL